MSEQINTFLKSQKRTKSHNIFSQWGVCCKAPVMKRLLHGRGACCQAPCWLAWLIRPRLHQSDIWSLYPKKPPVLEAAAMICPTITSIYLFISHTFLFPDPLDWRIGFHPFFMLKLSSQYLWYSPMSKSLKNARSFFLIKSL